MGFFDPHSEVVETDDGWVWLRPEPRSLRRRQVLAWIAVTSALGAGAAAVAFLAPAPRAFVAVVSLVTAVAVVRSATAAAHTRAGACAAGVLVQIGFRILQARWDAVQEVRARSASEGRAQLVVATDDGPMHTTRTTFDADRAEAWLERAAAAAGGPGRTVELLDGGPDFAVR